MTNKMTSVLAEVAEQFGFPLHNFTVHEQVLNGVRLNQQPSKCQDQQHMYSRVMYGTNLQLCSFVTVSVQKETISVGLDRKLIVSIIIRKFPL
jgi:hypothetical protein